MNLRNESGKEEGRIREEEKEGGNINKRHVFAVKRCRLLIQEPIIGSDALLIDGYGGCKEGRKVGSIRRRHSIFNHDERERER